MISVRDGTPGDADQLAQVEASATATLRLTYRPNDRALRNKQVLSSELRRLVAESDGRIVGTTQYFVDGDALRLIGLAVHGDFRRRGVARALVTAVAERARSQQLSSLVTRTVEETGNVPTFRALGFEVESRCPDEYSMGVAGGIVTDVSLRKKIAFLPAMHQTCGRGSFD